MDPIDTLTTNHPAAMFLVGYMAAHLYGQRLRDSATDLAWLRNRGYTAEADLLTETLGIKAADQEAVAR